MISTELPLPTQSQFKEHESSALFRMMSGRISDSKRVARLIYLLSQNFINTQNDAQQNTLPDERLKSSSLLVCAADRIVATVFLTACSACRLFWRIGRPWIRISRRVTKPTKRFRLRQWLSDLTLSGIDWALLACLRELKRSIGAKIFRGEKWPVGLVALIFFRGRLYMNKGLYAQAIDFFSAAVAWGYEHNEYVFFLALASQLSGRMPEAEGIYRQYLFFDAANPMVSLNLAHVLLALGQEEEAVQLLDRAIKKNPVLSMAHQNLAGFYDNAKYIPQPLDLARYPNVMLFDAYNAVGQQLVHGGHFEEGMGCYGKAIQKQRLLAEGASFPVELKRILARDFHVDSEEPFRILPYEWVTLIGHIALLDTYKKLQLLGMSSPGQPILLAPKCKVANCAYLDLWRKYFCVIEDETLVNHLFPYQRFFGDCFNGYITPKGVSRCWTELGAQGHVAWDAAGRGPLIKLSDETRNRGYAALKKFGMREGDWFVALHVRSGSFHREAKRSGQSHRNAMFEDYTNAILKITKRGGWVIRMGDPGMGVAPKMSKLIDYPNSNIKSPWMDVFLAGASKFFIGTTSGLTNAVISMGVPCLLVNNISNYHQFFNKRVLFTFKPLWDKNKRRFISVSEMTDNAFRGKLFNITKLDEMGIVAHSNTAAEIEAATSEMLTRVENDVAMRETEADCALRLQCDISGNPYIFGNGRLSFSFYESWKADLFNLP